MEERKFTDLELVRRQKLQELKALVRAGRNSEIFLRGRF